MAAKPIRFDEYGVPLCPNDCGTMAVGVQIPGPVTPETRARCRTCRHTMIVAVEGTVMKCRTSEGR